MVNADWFAQAKKRLCREIMAATSPFDLAKSLWDVAGLECRDNRFSKLMNI